MIDQRSAGCLQSGSEVSRMFAEFVGPAHITIRKIFKEHIVVYYAKLEIERY